MYCDLDVLVTTCFPHDFKQLATCRRQFLQSNVQLKAKVRTPSKCTTARLHLHKRKALSSNPTINYYSLDKISLASCSFEEGTVFLVFFWLQEVWHVCATLKLFSRRSRFCHKRGNANLRGALEQSGSGVGVGCTQYHLLDWGCLRWI